MMFDFADEGILLSEEHITSADWAWEHRKDSQLARKLIRTRKDAEIFVGRNSFGPIVNPNFIRDLSVDMEPDQAVRMAFKDAMRDWVGEDLFFQALLTLLNTRNGVDYRDLDLKASDKNRRNLGRPPLCEHRVVDLRLRYDDNPKDPGNWTGGKVGAGVPGGTKYGEASSSYADNLAKLPASLRASYPATVKDLTLDQVKLIFKTLYWDANRCDDLPPPLALLVFDADVNDGNGQRPERSPIRADRRGARPSSLYAPSED
jgi:hypothetical protein